MAIKILPRLYVEGTDDLSVISALMRRHSVDTDRGTQFLEIKDLKSVNQIIDAMPDAIKDATEKPVGFVVDIDMKVSHRWDAVASRLRGLGLRPPAKCPDDGYFGRMPDYPHEFGIWLMPDCKTDGLKLEHFVQSLIPNDHPLWPHAKTSTAEAAKIVDEANAAAGGLAWKRFSEADRIKAEVRSWLAWQSEPGVQLGAAINDHILGDESVEASAFLRWLKKLFDLSQLDV